ncbi:MAG: hypothetical protein WAU45_23470 [Blastocatellia bacterium]
MGNARGGTKGTQDTVTVILDRRTAENHYYALALALGGAGSLYGGKKGGKGKGKGKGKTPGKTPPKGKAPKGYTR